MNKIVFICFVFLLSIHNICEAQVQRVYIDFESPTGFIRTILLGFDPTNTATDGVDTGWDALNFDDFPDDLNWIIEDNRYIIQGVGEFNDTKTYPFGLYLTNAGTIKISLNKLENFDIPIDVYIHDTELDTYTKINTNDFTSTLTSGNYINRFYITFSEPALSVNQESLQQTNIMYFNNTKVLYINTLKSLIIEQIQVINLLGQTIKHWNVSNIANYTSNEVKIPVETISVGTYIIKVKTNRGIINKKVIIRQ